MGNPRMSKRSRHGGSALRPEVKKEIEVYLASLQID
jgi:hypothetical protein